MTHALLLLCFALTVTALLGAVAAAAALSLRRETLAAREAAREAARQKMDRHWARQSAEARTQLMDGYALARLAAAPRENISF